MGRPTDYSNEIADLICERIADGESLRSICSDESMPCRATVFRWLGLDKAFSDQYARAKEEQAELLADELVDIADEPPPLTAMGSTDSGAVAAMRLRIDTRKWVASKLKPKKYGDKVQTELSGPNGGPVESVLNVSGLPTEVLAAIVAAKDASDKG